MNDILKPPLKAERSDAVGGNVWRAKDSTGEVILLGQEDLITEIVKTINRAADLETLLGRMYLQQLKRAIDIKQYIPDNGPVTLVLNGYVVNEIREAIAKILGEQ